VSAIKSFKPLADFEWNWPTKIDRDVIERALTLDFLQQARNLVLVGRNGLGKTLIAKNICHAAARRTLGAVPHRPGDPRRSPIREHRRAPT